MNTLNKFVVFAVGAVIGSAATWRILKTKYERIANEEIESVKELFTARQEKSSQDEIDADGYDEMTSRFDPPNTPSIQEVYSDLIDDSGYTDYTNKKTIIEKEEVPNMPMDLDSPFIISPEEYGEEPEYETETLLYFMDGVLTDDMHYPIDFPNDIVGPGYAEHFGEYEEDSVFVRNRGLNTDYEILRDYRRYEDLPIHERPGDPMVGE